MVSMELLQLPGDLRVWVRSQGHPLDTMLEVERRPPGLQAASEWDGLALPHLQSGKQLPSTSGLGRAEAWGRAEQSFLPPGCLERECRAVSKATW